MHKTQQTWEWSKRNVGKEKRIHRLMILESQTQADSGDWKHTYGDEANDRMKFDD